MPCPFAALPSQTRASAVDAGGAWQSTFEKHPLPQPGGGQGPGELRYTVCRLLGTALARRSALCPCCLLPVICDVVASNAALVVMHTSPPPNPPPGAHARADVHDAAVGAAGGPPGEGRRHLCAQVGWGRGQSDACSRGAGCRARKACSSNPWVCCEGLSDLGSHSTCLYSPTALQERQRWPEHGLAQGGLGGAYTHTPPPLQLHARRFANQAGLAADSQEATDQLWRRSSKHLMPSPYRPIAPSPHRPPPTGRSDQVGLLPAGAEVQHRLSAHAPKVCIRMGMCKRHALLLPLAPSVALASGGGTSSGRGHLCRR